MAVILCLQQSELIQVLLSRFAAPIQSASTRKQVASQHIDIPG
jgi:hypothetical protein